MGYGSGPRLGRILEEVKALQLEGSLCTPEEARSHVTAHHPIDPKDGD